VQADAKVERRRIAERRIRADFFIVTSIDL
jgi:hypothetical protein